MANYANQLTIHMSDLEKIKHKEGDNHNRFIQPLDFKYEAIAMRRLNGNAFKLWRYFLRWYGGQKQYEFSPAALKKELGFGKNGSQDALKELILKGYVKQIPDKNNTYVFIPVLDIDYLELKDKNDF